MSIFTGCISELSKTEEKVNEETLLKRLSEPDNYYSKIDITYVTASDEPDWYLISGQYNSYSKPIYGEYLYFTVQINGKHGVILDGLQIFGVEFK